MKDNAVPGQPLVLVSPCLRLAVPPDAASQPQEKEQDKKGAELLRWWGEQAATRA